MDNYCQYCNHEMDYESNYVPYGSTSEDAGGWYCTNDNCLGDAEPSCFECGNYAWQTGDDELIKHFWEGSEETFCACCLEGYLNQEIAA